MPIKSYPRLTLAIIYGLMPALIVLAAGLSRGQPITFLQIWAAFSFYDFIAVLMVAVISVTHTLLRVNQVSERAQIIWIAWGTLLTSIGSLSGSFILMNLSGQGLVLGWFFSRLLQLGFPLSLAIAILRYHLFDIDMVVNRTIVYGIVTLLLGLIYFCGVVVFQLVFGEALGSNSSLATFVSTIAIAFLFQPVRLRVQDFINSRFYRRRYNADQTIDVFRQQLRLEVEQEKLIRELVGVVNETMQPESVTLWIRPIKNQEQE